MPIENDGLTAKSKLQVDFREISLTGSRYYHSQGVPDYNPDELVGRKGLEIYKKMRDDDQVKAVLTMKKFARLMTPWEVQPASQDAMDVEIAEFVKVNFQNLEGTFEDNLLNIFTALDFGFSLTEKLWYRIEKGSFTGKIGLKSLKTREPFYYQFESDNFGNLRKDGIIYCGPGSYENEVKGNDENVIQSLNNNIYGRRLPIDKFIIYSYNREFSNHYGRSDLRGAYRSWWSKELLIRFMNMYMERFGMPTHVAKVPKSMSKPDKEKLQIVLDRVQSKYSIVIPEDVAIELLNAGTGGEGSFRDSIEMHNKFISRSILVPDLMGFNTMSGGGSYALGKKHFDVFLWILQKLGRDLEETVIGEQVIKQLVDYNYSNVEDYPKFKFESITAEGTATRASIIQMGVAGGFINPEEEWIREYLALPKADPSKPLGMPKEQLPGGLGGSQFPKKIGTEEGVKDVEDKSIDDLLADVDDEVSIDKGMQKYNDAIRKWKVKKFAEDSDIERWVTINGRKVPIVDGKPQFGGDTGKESKKFPEHIVEDVEGTKHKVTSFPKDWGLGKGTYTAYRAGTVDTSKGLVFFAPDKESAEPYGYGGERVVKEYEVELKNPAVFANQIEAYSRLTGVPRQVVIARKNRAPDNIKWFRDLDKKLGYELKRKGYDSLVLTRPLLPALREIAILSAGASKEKKSFIRNLDTGIFEILDFNLDSNLVDINKIKPNPEQNKIIDGNKVQSMVTTLQRGEELSPIEVDKDYNLINGHHRLMAYKMVGKKEIPVEVVEKERIVKSFQKEDKLPQDDRFDYKIDFKQMEEDLDEYETDTVDSLSKIIKEQKDALLKSIEKKKIIEDKDYTAVDNLQLKFVGDFKKDIEQRLIKLYLDSKLEMIRELAKGSEGQIQVVTKFADVTIQNWIPVPPTEAIDFFNRKVLAKIITSEGIKKIITMATRKELEYYDSKAFAIAGVERDTILKKAKFILLDGLKTGASNKDVMFNLGNMFDEYLVTGELKDEELVTPARLETIVRTNFSEALNAGRKAMFDNPILEDFVPYVQWKAILDSRVRPSHAEMHNKIFKRDDPSIANLPPAGFNCRCLFSGITKIEVQKLIKNGDGIEVSTVDDFPADFPDKGFNTYTDNLDRVIQIQSIKDIVKCPYKGCSALPEDIEWVSKDEFDTMAYKCKVCKNQFKITKEKELYLYNKVNNTWIKESISGIKPEGMI